MRTEAEHSSESWTSGRTRTSSSQYEPTGGGGLPSPFLPTFLELAPTGTFATRLGRVGIKLPFTLQPGTSATRRSSPASRTSELSRYGGGAYQIRSWSCPYTRAERTRYTELADVQKLRAGSFLVFFLVFRSTSTIGTATENMRIGGSVSVCT